MIDFWASTTRKNTTAFTLTDTLSREMTSWLGTSRTTTRRSTLTICWIPRTTSTSPGPLTFQNRPSMKTTPRSYSRKTRRHERTNAPTAKMRTRSA